MKLNDFFPFELAFNHELEIRPAYLDNGPAITLHTLREFNIEDQNNAEFWYNIRPEFWPDIEL
jgi:hypothetical protein